MAGQRDVTDWMEGLPARAGSASVDDLLFETFTQLSVLREAVLPLEEASPHVMRPPQDLSRDEPVTALQQNAGPPLLLAEYLRAEQELGRVSAEFEPARLAIMILAPFLGVQTSPMAGATGLDDEDVRAIVSLTSHGIATT